MSQSQKPLDLPYRVGDDVVAAVGPIAGDGKITALHLDEPVPFAVINFVRGGPMAVPYSQIMGFVRDFRRIT